MALITRVSRLFRADFHAVLDRIEEPDLLLRQAVREMEEELARDEQRFKLLHQEQGQFVSRKGDIDQALQEIGQELDVCFAAGQEELARSTIKRRLETERFAKYLSRKINALQQEIAGLGARIEQNRIHLDSMRQKAELLAEEHLSSRCHAPMETPDISVQPEETEVAFLREKQNRSAS